MKIIIYDYEITDNLFWKIHYSNAGNKYVLSYIVVKKIHEICRSVADYYSKTFNIGKKIK